MIKNFAVFKNTKKESEKQPDYNLSIKVGESYVNVGGGWIKEGKSGKFISFKLSDAFGDRKGYSITEDKTSSLTEEDKATIKTIKSSAGFTPEEIDF